jgi:Tol biopolymer transport system component
MKSHRKEGENPIRNRQIILTTQKGGENPIRNRRVILTTKFKYLHLWLVIATFCLSLTTGCRSVSIPQGPSSLNSRYHDQEPSLSGDGKLLAFISNRDGKSRIYIYNLEQKTLVNLPGLNIGDAIAQTPSLSYTGRYITYLSSIQGRPDLILYDRATRQSELLTRNYRSWIRNPQISPDGRYIVFETSRRGQWDLEVLDRGPFVEPDLPDGIPIPLP